MGVSQTRTGSCSRIFRHTGWACRRRFAFPLAPGLGFTGSAPDYPGLSIGFSATQPGSDVSRAFIGGFGSSPSRHGPIHHDGHRPIKTAPGSRTRYVRTCQGLRPRRAGLALARTCLSLSPSDSSTPSAPGRCNFRGSMAGLCTPLPTLRRRPHGRQRTAWGRCGSRRLHRDGLAPSIPCRSPSALSNYILAGRRKRAARIPDVYTGGRYVDDDQSAHPVPFATRVTQTRSGDLHADRSFRHDASGRSSRCYQLLERSASPKRI